MTWDEAFAAIAAVNHGGSVAAVAGDLVDCETMFGAKALLNDLALPGDRLCATGFTRPRR